jgi:2-polyprenyl-3-methyl-5-hydroxy-6-metoxy-1,4-benzoquinol methylase
MNAHKNYEYTHGGPRHSFAYLLPPLLSLVDKERNKCILDLGCGNGYLANYLLQLGYNAYGTDASEDGVAVAKQQNPDRFFVQDLATGQLPDQLLALKFDTILSTEVIEHLYDPGGFLEFCRQLLPKNGELILSTPYHGYWKYLALAIFNKWDRHLNPAWRGGHIKFWSRKTLSQLLKDTGFTVIAFKGCGRLPYFWKSMIIKARLD